ncbi:MAG: L,D-transpeptidase family protein [Pseudorhodoplanes sp.]
MYRTVCLALAISALGMTAAYAQPMSLAPGYYVAPAQAPEPRGMVQAGYQNQPDLGGGFIEFLFGGGNGRAPRYQSAPMQQPMMQEPMMQQPDLQQAPGSPPLYANSDPAAMAQPQRQMDPRFSKQVVAYNGPEKPGTVIIDTPQRFLFLVESGGKATRYGIGVGRPGFTWAGVKTVSLKREWPDWTPPPEMLQRRPDLPHFMAGGPENPLGARAMYLGSSLYRIHGSNEPWTIGHAVSSGCIRMRNEDVIDLYERVKVGTKVVVI